MNLDPDKLEELYHFKKIEESYNAYIKEIKRLIKGEIEHYKQQAKLLKEFNFDKYQEQLQGITQNFNRLTRIQLQEGRELCKAMIVEFRHEAQELEKEWRCERDVAKRLEDESTLSMLKTAKMLQMVELFENAKSLREEAQKFDERLEKRLAEIDREYEKKYIAMINRQEVYFRHLHKRVSLHISDTKSRAEHGKKHADQDKETDDNIIPAVIISSVCARGKFEESKLSVIGQFSPRTYKASQKADETIGKK